MRFWRWIKSLFKQDKPVVVETPIPDLNEEGYVVPCIGLVVGHNARDKGATNYLKESEWDFNSRIARKVQLRLNELGIRSVIVFRPTKGRYSSQCSSVARELKGKLATHAVCLHFNSTKGAMGCEVLVGKTTTVKDNQFADEVTDILNEEYGFIERRDDGVFEVSSKHNGAGMLNAINRKGIISALVEPCFADEPTKESRLIFEQEDKYVLVLTKAIHKVWTK